MADDRVSVPRPRCEVGRGSGLCTSLATDPESGIGGRFVRGADRISAEEVAGLVGVSGVEFEPSSKQARWLRYLQEMARRKEQLERLLLEGTIRDFDPKQGGDEAKLARWLRYQQEMAPYKELRQRQLLLEDTIRDFDPKQGGEYYNRLYYVDHTRFDLDEESPLGPMRFTDAVYKNNDDYELCEGINIFSVKISSDVGFPIDVYGTVIARDSLDKKCVYLFRHDRDHCQHISSEDESLILRGPKRGLALIGDNYVEIDLKIKNNLGQDKEFSKGILTIDGASRSRFDQCELESGSLATRLSTVDVTYGVVKDAVEGTIAIEVLEGNFNGKITAQASSIQKSLVVYDSELVGAMAGDGNGVLQLMRPVVSVYVKEKLIITAQSSDSKSGCNLDFIPKINGGEDITVAQNDDSKSGCTVGFTPKINGGEDITVARTSDSNSGCTIEFTPKINDGKEGFAVAQANDSRSECTIEFTPKINGRKEEEITVGVTKLRVKVTWSIMDY